MSAAEAYFGSWGKALYAAGIDPNLYFFASKVAQAEHTFSQTGLGKRGSPVGEQPVLIVSAHDNYRRLVELLGR